jgi:two-component system response regulator YesN
MYRMMIVEDEPWIRKGIEKVLPWEELNIEYVGYASNGEEAMQVLDTYLPDIIITDIRMPKVDGITLIKNIHDQLSPGIQIVVLTGYNDFAYIKEAFKYSVADYILKPINPAELMETMTRITIKLDRKKEVNLHIFQLQLGNYIYEHLLTPIEDPDITLELPDHDSCFLFSVEPIPSEILKTDVLVSHVFSYPAGYSTIYYVSFHSRADAECFLHTALKQMTNKYTLGISSIFTNDPEQFQEAFKEARYSLQQKLNKESESAPGELEIGNTLLTHDKEIELIALLRSGNKQEAHNFIHHFLSSFPTFNTQWTIVFQLYTMLMRYCSAEKLTIKQTNWIYGFKSVSKKEDISLILDEYIYPIVDLIIGDWNRDCSDIAKKTMKYVDDHYANPSLSLSEVATEFQLAPSYLSYIFTSQLNINYVSYLAKKRIEKAKEKLAKSNEQVYLISDSVGFNDVKYFIRVFKKMTGLTPKEFREKKISK